jgi:LmbE family N-acetylglucosaminyl deacetylase
MAAPEPVMFVVAHPDDVAFSMGGTAWLLKERGCALSVVCASRGERGYRWEGAGPKPANRELAAVRSAEEAACCALLGADLDFLDLPDGEIYADRAACEAVAERLSAVRPRAVLTHGPLEKPDHAAVCQMTLKALDEAGLFWTTECYMSLDPTSNRNAAYAPIYVDISDVVARKADLIRCHRSHLEGRAGYLEGLIETNRLLGRLAVCGHAEAWQPSLALANRRGGGGAPPLLLELQGRGLR